MFSQTYPLKGWPHPAAVFWGLVCAGLAWVLRPRVLEMPQDIVPQEHMPTLYRMTSEIARKLDAPPVDAIVVDEEFNAAFGRAGWRGRKVLYVGLPLLAILDDQEKLALIGHELAHSVNGDPRRGFFVGTAVASLVEWYAILHPGDVFDTHGEPLGFLMIPFNVVMLGLAKIVWLAAYALSQFLWRNSQRAEYLADYLATQVSGTGSMMSMLRKLHLGRTFTLVVQNIGLSRRQQSLFDELRQRVQTVPPRELERIRRVEQLELSRLDVSHPPTAYRVAFLEAHGVEQPQPLFSASDFEKLEQELAPFEGRIQKKLVDQHAASLYYR